LQSSESALPHIHFDLPGQRRSTCVLRLQNRALARSGTEDTNGREKHKTCQMEKADKARAAEAVFQDSSDPITGCRRAVQ